MRAGVDRDDAMSVLKVAGGCTVRHCLGGGNGACPGGRPNRTSARLPGAMADDAGAERWREVRRCGFGSRGPRFRVSAVLAARGVGRRRRYGAVATRRFFRLVAGSVERPRGRSTPSCSRSQRLRSRPPA